MTLGQGAELVATKSGKILSLAEVLEIFENKTAPAFRVSLLLGGIMGGTDAETLELLGLFSHYTGIAYQIMDDMEDYAGQQGDIRFRKPSVMLAILLEELPPEERTIIEQAFTAGNFNLIDLCLENYQTVDRCSALLKSYLNRARGSLDNLGNMGLKLALHEILGKIFDKYS
jgi:geranylgeranyl pyrophosphate synthase